MHTPGERFAQLVDIMRTLRSPGGCPWDREQTLQSLRPFLLEETYEVLEAIDSGDTAGLREELGDLLFEVVFLAQIADEQGRLLGRRRDRDDRHQARAPASARVRQRRRGRSRPTRCWDAGRN